MRRRKNKRDPQLTLELMEPMRHGGTRKGAGRKRRAPRRLVSHRRRCAVNPHHPQHVTLRVLDGVGSLRRRHAYHAVRKALLVIQPRDDFRVVHLSIQGNHIHLICEAGSREALSSGIAGLKISTARRLNNKLGRSGHLFSDRYHASPITCPGQARAAISYCLNNWRRHGVDQDRGWRVDPFSSAPTWRDWRELETGPALILPKDYEPLPVSKPTTWMLRVGWKRARKPAISWFEVPGPAA